MKQYKIYSPSKKKFAAPSNYHKWTSVGKTWQHIGHVVLHLAYNAENNPAYDDAVVIEYELTEVRRIPARQLHEEKSKASKERRDALARKTRDRQKKYLQAELRRVARNSTGSVKERIRIKELELELLEWEEEKEGIDAD